MKIILLGANVRTGRLVLSRSLRAGDSITALVRAKDSLNDVSHERLEIAEGDVCEPNVLDAILPDKVW
jgi:putative NADH-flavin reductase